MLQEGEPVSVEEVVVGILAVEEGLPDEVVEMGGDRPVREKRGEAVPDRREGDDGADGPDFPAVGALRMQDELRTDPELLPVRHEVLEEREAVVVRPAHAVRDEPDAPGREGLEKIVGPAEADGGLLAPGRPAEERPIERELRNRMAEERGRFDAEAAFRRAQDSLPAPEERVRDATRERREIPVPDVEKDVGEARETGVERNLGPLPAPEGHERRDAPRPEKGTAAAFFVRSTSRPDEDGFPAVAAGDQFRLGKSVEGGRLQERADPESAGFRIELENRALHERLVEAQSVREDGTRFARGGVGGQHRRASAFPSEEEQLPERVEPAARKEGLVVQPAEEPEDLPVVRSPFVPPHRGRR